MERNTVTVVGELKTGDRFYLSNNKSKIVYRVVRATYRKGKPTLVKADNDAQDKNMRNTTSVVFLRHKEEGYT